MKYIALFSCVLLLCGCAQQASVNPKAASINAELGTDYLSENQWQRSYEKLQLAYQQSPKQQDVLLALANYYMRTHKIDQAHKYFKLALNYYPSSGQVLNNYAVFLCQQKKYQQAIRLFKQAVADDAYANQGLAERNYRACLHRFNQAAGNK